MTLRIVELGDSTTVQDLGRIGMGALGVPRAGAVDRESMRLVNRAVGNPDDAAVLETLGGLVVEAAYDMVVATSTIGERRLLRAKEHLTVDPTDGSRWAYLAVRGGVDDSLVLGSRSRDDLCRVGPMPLATGAILPVGRDPGTPIPDTLPPPRRAPDAVALWEGPDYGDLIGGLAAITGNSWVVGRGDRTSVRISNATAARTTFDRSSPDKGLIEGAVCIDSSGDLVIMLANHRISGNDPVVAVVAASHLSQVAQAPVGSLLSFGPV